ncbi:UNVERIFIED_CONTAM: hypothetical protein FKN15_031214 [Acipenser sinensis]
MKDFRSFDPSPSKPYQQPMVMNARAMHLNGGLELVQIIPPLLDLNQNRSKLKLYIGHLTALCQDRDPQILQGITPPTSYHHDDRAAWEEELQKMSLEQIIPPLLDLNQNRSKLKLYIGHLTALCQDRDPQILQGIAPPTSYHHDD